MRNVRALSVLTLAAALTLGGCGTNGQPSAGSGHNQADVTFATDMIQHHAQALQMVDLTRGRDLDPHVAALADDVLAAQSPEIETMTGWLTDWDEPVPETVRDHANADGDHSMGSAMGGDMPGMMTDDEMQSLERANGSEFQDRWLEMMTEHHNGAVSMAQTEQDDGAYGPAVRLAERVERSQTAEITQMEKLGS